MLLFHECKLIFKQNRTMVLPGLEVHLCRLLIGPVDGATSLVLPRTAGKMG